MLLVAQMSIVVADATASAGQMEGQNPRQSSNLLRETQVGSVAQSRHDVAFLHMPYGSKDSYSKAVGPKDHTPKTTSWTGF